MNESLPLHGDTPPTLLDPEPSEVVAQLQLVLSRGPEDDQLGDELRRLVASRPTFLDGWAHLADWARRTGDPVAAYAFARTGYHRGLDGIRKAGWRGHGAVPWRHEPNRGFLRSLHELMLAAAAIGERDEALRCRDFLLELDPDDALGVRGVEAG